MRYALYPFVHGYLVEMVDLWIAAWSQTLPSIDFETRRVWIGERIVGLLERGVSIKCALDTTNGDVAGFITLDLATGHIDQLAVLPDRWGTGAAETLLNDAKLSAFNGLFLEVNQDNLRAARFYEKQGFRRTAKGVNPNSGLKTWQLEWKET